MKAKQTFVLSWVAMALLAASTRADLVLMVDFGAVVPTGDSLLNSPYHTANGSFSDSSWNRAGADMLTGMVWSDGTAATGVSLNIGSTASADATELNLAGSFTSSALGGSVNTGVYTNTSVGKDGVFAGSGAAQLRHVGFQIAGLSAGLYDVYVTGRNTNTGNDNSPIFRLGTTASAGNFDFTSYDTLSLSYVGGSTASTASWVQNGGGTGVNGENYVKFTIALAEDSYLNLATAGTHANEMRGFLGSVQIVAVPEPSVLVLLGCGLASLALFRRRA